MSKPKGNSYTDVDIPLRWERIEDSHYLVPIPVSEYIRALENQTRTPARLAGVKIKREGILKRLLSKLK